MFYRYYFNSFIQGEFYVMGSFVQDQVTIPKSDKEIRISICPLETKSTKYKDGKMTEIVNTVVALLNSGGGKLVLCYESPLPETHLDFGRTIEQKVIRFLGSTRMVLKIKTTFLSDGIDFQVDSSDALITLNYNLCLATPNQVIHVLPTDALEEVIKVISREKYTIVELSSYLKDFFKGKNVESKEDVNVQFKSLKAAATKRVTLADRVVSKSNKLALYVSAFANHGGGHVYYGIDDDGIVEGEEVSNKDEIIRKVDKAMSKLIWPDYCCKPQRGQEWDIFFVPVKNSEGEVIPSIFVIVIAVGCCSGGVFVDVPESYHIVDGKVEKMSLELWKAKFLSSATASATEDNQSLVTTDRVGKETPGCPAPRTSLSSPSESGDLRLSSRIPWTKKSNETRYMMLTEYLENLRQLGKWSGIRDLAQMVKNHHHSSINDELVSIFQLTAVAYRQGHFKKAKDHLKDFQTKVSSSEDSVIFQLEGCYSASSIERSRGDYKQAWTIIEDGLSLVNRVPAGLVPAAFLLNAGSILISLMNDKSYLADSKKQSHGLTLKKRNVDQAKRYCHEALDHLKYVKKEYEIAKEELSQRISVTLCFLYLGSSISAGPYEEEGNSTSVSTDDLDCVVEKIADSKKSLEKCTDREMLYYNNCRLQIVESDMYFRRSQQSCAASEKGFYVKRSLALVENVFELAKTKKFQEIMRYCNFRIARLQIILVPIKVSVNEEKEEQLEEANEQLLRKVLQPD